MVGGASPPGSVWTVVVEHGFGGVNRKAAWGGGCGAWGWAAGGLWGRQVWVQTCDGWEAPDDWVVAVEMLTK